MNTIKYFDNAATTPMYEDVIKEMGVLSTRFFNPSSSYQESAVLKKEIQQVKSDIGQLLNCSPDQIIFTSGATEANNMVIKGFYYKNKSPYHVISSAIEHPSILEPFAFLEKEYQITRNILPAPNGQVTVEGFKKAIQENTLFSSIMYVNNELGSIQPIDQLVSIARENGIYFHTDATQAIGKIPVDLSLTDVDALSFSGHKLFGPKGVGVLYLKDTSSIEPLFHGGGQENGLRSGTENTLFILALGIVVKRMIQDLNKIESHYADCKQSLLEFMRDSNLPFVINNSTENANNIISMRVKNMRGEALTGILDLKYNIKISNGSACSSNKEAKLSYTLKEFGLSDQEIRETIRVSFGLETTKDEIGFLVNALNEIYASYEN